jgi:hypothetical protein
VNKLLKALLDRNATITMTRINDDHIGIEVYFNDYRVAKKKELSITDDSEALGNTLKTTLIQVLQEFLIDYQDINNTVQELLKEE